MIEIISLGFFASFVLSRTGTAHQYFKYKKNKKGKISTNYRGLDNLLYLSELAWGLSIQPINLTVTVGNAISLIFPSLILYEIWRDRRDKNVILWCFTYAMFLSAIVTLMVLDWPRFQEISHGLGDLVIILCFISLWGMWENIQLIRNNPGNSKRQSLAEIYLKIFKDIIGLAFCFTSGISTMYPLAFGLASRGIMRSIHLYFYLRSLSKYKSKNLEINPVIKEKSNPSSQVTTIETNVISPTQSKILARKKTLINPKNK